MRTHYRSNANFTMQGLQDCQRMIDRWSRAHAQLVDRAKQGGAPDEARAAGPFERALAAFTDDDVALYEQLHDLPKNPLSERGYPSIGCWPCTRPVAPGEDKRAGRWAGSAKTECGLHV